MGFNFGLNLDLTTWLLGGLAALLVGFSKTGVPGLGILIVPLMAMVFPAKISVGALLPMLVVGDVFAVAFYRQHTHWNKLWPLFPWVLVGTIPGAWALKNLESVCLEPVLGWLVLAMIALELSRRQFGWEHIPHHPAFVAATGVAAGFATTLGNVAGPIMTIYFLSKGLDRDQLIGTGAWYFLIINVSKLPIFGALHMITAETLWFNVLMIPAIVVGALVGKWALPRISQRAFAATVMVLAAIAAARLVFR